MSEQDDVTRLVNSTLEIAGTAIDLKAEVGRLRHVEANLRESLRIHQSIIDSKDGQLASREQELSTEKTSHQETQRKLREIVEQRDTLFEQLQETERKWKECQEQFAWIRWKLATVFPEITATATFGEIQERLGELADLHTTFEERTGELQAAVDHYAAELTSKEQQLSSLRIQLEATTKQLKDAERDLLAQHPLIADLKARLECRKIATEQQIIGALKSAIVAHGPITLDLMGSAAKRLFGAMGTERINELESAIASLKQERERLEAENESLEARAGVKQADQDAIDSAWAIAAKSVNQQERIRELEEALRSLLILDGEPFLNNSAWHAARYRAEKLLTPELSKAEATVQSSKYPPGITAKRLLEIIDEEKPQSPKEASQRGEKELLP